MNKDDDHPPTRLVRHAPQPLSIVDDLARRGLRLIQSSSEAEQSIYEQWPTSKVCQFFVHLSGRPSTPGLYGTIRDCNDVFAGTLGFEKNELIGASVSTLYVRPVEFDELTSMLHDAAWSVPQEITFPDSTSTTEFLSSLQNVEREFRHRDGSRVWLIQNLYLIRKGVEGGETSLWIVSLDISELKRQKEPRSSNDAIQRLAQLNVAVTAAFKSS